MTGRDARTQPTRRPPQASLLERPDRDDLIARVEGGDRRRAADPERQVGREVLDDLEAGFRGEPRELAPTGLGHDDAGRVLEGRDDVDEPDRSARAEQADDLDTRRRPRRPGWG